MTRRVLGSGLLAVFLLAPSFACAGGTAAVGVVVPGETVGTDTTLAFSMIVSGFTNPTYFVTDSFPGGVSSANMDSQGNLFWRPNRDDIGTHNLTITVSDTLGNLASATKTITVVKTSVSVGQLLPGAVVRYGNPVSFQITGLGFVGPVYSVGDSFPNSSMGPFNTNQSGGFYWVPLYHDIGTHVLTVAASDMQGHSADVQQTITVEGTPGVTAVDVYPGVSIGVGQTLSFSATTTGFSTPSFTVIDLFYTGAATSTLKLEGHAVSWTPVYNDLGVHTFAVSATDSAGHSASTQLRVTVGQYATVTPAPKTTPATTTNASPAPAPTAPAAFKSFLTVGSRGAEVTALQKKLIVLGLLSGEATGYFGALTKKAVQAFQKSKGLEQVGFTGPGTRAALNK